MQICRGCFFDIDNHNCNRCSNRGHNHSVFHYALAYFSFYALIYHIDGGGTIGLLLDPPSALIIFCVALEKKPEPGLLLLPKTAFRNFGKKVDVEIKPKNAIAVNRIKYSKTDWPLFKDFFKSIIFPLKKYFYLALPQ